MIPIKKIKQTYIGVWKGGKQNIPVDD